MDAGWVKLHRSALQTPALCSAISRGIWMTLLLRAAHKPRQVNWRGQTVALAPGELIVSVRSFATAADISHKMMRTTLERFEREGMIQQTPILGTVRGTGRGTVGTRLTICNYERYQATAEQRGTMSGTVSGTTGAQQGHTEQESKNPVPNGTDASPNGDASHDPHLNDADLDALVYRRARALLGKNAGGQITRLRRIIGDGQILELIEKARRKDQPGSWFAAAIKRLEQEARRAEAKRDVRNIYADLMKAGGEP